MKFGHFWQLFNKPGVTGYPRYEQMWRELELADELEFDYGFQSIHHSFKLRPTPAMFCAGAAARTRQIRLGPMGYIAPLYDPIRIVEEALLLDQLTNGRLELGLVLGVYPEYFRVYGADPETRRESALETIKVLKAAFATEGNFSFKGQFHQYDDIELAIRPVQNPGPPISLPTTNPDTMAFCAKEGVHGGYINPENRQEMAARLVEYQRMWYDAGHQDPPNISYCAHVYVDETDEAALAKGRDAVLYNMYETYTRNPARGGIFSSGTDSLGPRTSEIFKNRQNFDYLHEQNVVFVGSPETVINRIRAAAEEGFFNIFVGEFNLGALSEEDVLRSIRLFGTQIIPALRDMDPTA